MEESLSTLTYLLIGYICGVFFAPDIFEANILATDWYNIWTYAWLLFWPVMLAAHFLLPFFAAAPAVVVVKA